MGRTKQSTIDKRESKKIHSMMIDRDSFTRVWRCGVADSGYHNGVRCHPFSISHADSWGCGWYYEIVIRYREDAFFARWGKPEE